MPGVPWEAAAAPDNARRTRSMTPRNSYGTRASVASAMSPHGMSPHADSDTELGSSMHGASDEEGSESDLSGAITLSSAGSMENMMPLLCEAVLPGSHHHHHSRQATRAQASSSPAARTGHTRSSRMELHPSA